MIAYGFWNNKGGTGKTSLAFQAICHFAHQHKDKKILVIDVCPQANLSELLLGGLTGSGSSNLLKCHGQPLRCSIGGYFQLRMPSPFSTPNFNANDFITNPHKFNSSIDKNIDLVCGDALLELQANAINTLANTQVPGTNTWIKVIDWIKDFLRALEGQYDYVFIDGNPSFSIYTQIALSTVDRLVLPVMADDSSRRAIQNAFSLIYGLRLPSPIYSQHAFATRLTSEGRSLPKVHLIVKNRLTQYMGPASAYAAVLTSVEADLQQLLKSNPQYFTFKKVSDGVAEMRDFQTAGVVAFARGCPFYSLPSGRLDISGHRVQVKDEYLRNCIKDINAMVTML